MPADLAILSNPKIKKLFVDSLLARRSEIAEDIVQIDATLSGLGVDILPPTPPPIRRNEQPSEVFKKGQRMQKGLAEKLIAGAMQKRPSAEWLFEEIVVATNIASTTAWRALNRLIADGKVARNPDKTFQWKTDLPVAGGNGKGAET